MSRDFHLPGRSPVIACEGMAATSHPLASLAAIETLRAGGTAADAAVAAVAVLCVVEPEMTGIGGDCFCLLPKPGRPVWGYNGSGRAGARASTRGADGAGHAPRSPAIRLTPSRCRARSKPGRRSSRRMADSVSTACCSRRSATPRTAFRLRRASPGTGPRGRRSSEPHAGSARHYLLERRARRQIGDVVRLPALAATLKAIAAGGAKAFYEGAIAADIVATVQAAGGSLLAAEDLARHRGDVVAPIATNYRGLDVVELPPNGQGLTALVLLNILEQFDLAALDPIGAGAPASRARSRAACLSACATRTSPILPTCASRSPALLDKGFAAKLAALHRSGRRVPMPSAPPPGSDTVYLTVVDRDRMAVSLINSLYFAFWHRHLHRKDRHHAAQPRRRLRGRAGPPEHDRPASGRCIPSFRRSRCATGAARCSFGVMGADYQPMGHAQIVTNMVDYGMDVQAAIDGPRVFFVEETSVVERGLPRTSVEGLGARGHEVELAPRPWGGAQAIRIDWERGVLIGGSDPRKDGCALGY